MKKILLAGVLAILGALMLAPATGAQADLDCGDFASQAAAQAFFEVQGGPAADPHRLDADNDGIACENFNYSATGGGGDDNGTTAAGAQYDQYAAPDQYAAADQYAAPQQPAPPQAQALAAAVVEAQALPATGGPALLLSAGVLLLGAGLIGLRMTRRS